MAEEETEATASEEETEASASEEGTEAAASEENAESSGEEVSSDTEVVEGKFGKAEIVIPETVQKAPEESQKHYHSIANKGETLKVASEKVLGANSKDELKEHLPAAIVVKKNLRKDVDTLYNSYKEFKNSSESPDEVEQFKEACNDVIRNAQKAHGEIKEKINSVYGKS